MVSRHDFETRRKGSRGENEYIVLNFRFEVDPLTGSFRKNARHLHFQTELNLRQYTVEGLQSHLEYDLISVINHTGSLDRGHNYAPCKRDGRLFVNDVRALNPFKLFPLSNKNT